jgi:hypothetical protein
MILLINYFIFKKMASGVMEHGFVCNIGLYPDIDGKRYNYIDKSQFISMNGIFSEPCHYPDREPIILEFG